MGTSNFARPQNASKYFVVLIDRDEEFKECNDCSEKHYSYEYNLEDLKQCQGCDSKDLTGIETETVSPDEWEYDDLKDNIGCELESLGGNSLNESIGNDRYYHRQAIGSLSSSKTYGDLEVKVVLRVLIQSAYYEGATLDYLIEVFNGYEYVEVGEYDDVDDILLVLFTEYYSEMPIGMLKIQQKNAENWVENQIKILRVKVETVLEQYSEHKLVCKGVFSNGEAVYNEIK